jgi:hypothetical protein
MPFGKRIGAYFVTFVLPGNIRADINAGWISR